MGALIYWYFLNNITGFAINHVPKSIFQRWQVHGKPVGRDRHAVAATVKPSFPNHFFCGKVNTLQAFQRTYINAVKRYAYRNAFYVRWLAIRVQALRRYS